ncbi:4-(cytidine 5'-diphospho)-2-C-methyl-D-erythritol kinase [Fulvivirga sediminis]|uniref:4-diphosphocytidyl-2-C-methyl-D-erythritol kinase n=1 Tax=Fulvivirga sediminis TaxID=2803949 RepID=A0A937K288_9BACT|nr:4-(cytidine 5'-diphospho)-2-C-methyl-D-erythritol kinase [Fulvivirga sediminis]MBL3657537.1 4-(cytidine 5'-diphospho)-2-C-methyl-D-erythritol kinase [Fulvivirga sediminis]
MVVFPNIKINLGLNILSRREDGYHNISSVFYPLPFTDILEILPDNDFSFVSTGLPIPGNTEDNLIIKAYNLLKEAYKLPPVSIHLHKIIPMGAGLGGGSADGAFTIKCLNQLFGLNLSTKTMEDYASRLGSDCPFFIENKPVLVEGTGNVFSEIELSLEGKYLILIYPEVHVSTAQAYSKVTPKQPEISITDIIKNKPLSEWKNVLNNDFENSVFQQFPSISKVKNELYEAGATYSSMTGSGASVFGIFDKKPSMKLPNIIWEAQL